jgi:flagellar FliL protein
MEVEVNGEEQRLLVEKRIPQLRDTVLLLLSSRSLKDINTMEGKLELKQALLARMNRVLGEGMIHRLYFTEFVVQ